MTLQQIKKIISSTGIQNAYKEFEKMPKLPYILFYYDDTDVEIADDEIYFETDNYIIELYTKKKDLASEKKIENLLKENKIIYHKSETYLKDEKTFIITYEI